MKSPEEVMLHCFIAVGCFFALWIKKIIIHDILCNFFVQPVHTAKIMTMNWKAQRVQWIFESNIVKYLLLYSMIHFYNRHTEIANCFLHSSIFSPHSKGNTLEGSHICQERRSENSEFRKTKCKRINIQNVMHNVQWELFFRIHFDIFHRKVFNGVVTSC